MLTSIKGRVAVVTGASLGIGKGISRAFARQGARVLVVARQEARAAAVAAEIREAGGEASTFACDVTDPDSMLRMAQTVQQRYGGIDILCANAGIFPAAPLERMISAQWDEVLGTNLKGTFLAVLSCLPELKRSPHGRIVITSSITGFVTGYQGWSHYGKQSWSVRIHADGCT